jgi:glycogen operon protein
MARLLPGKPYPQGATWDGIGVNFSVYSEAATGVELCLFDDTDGEATDRYRLKECTANVWHGYLQGVKPGQLYGYRMCGPYSSGEGQRFNCHKLLIDPYARALAGQVTWNQAVFGYRLGEDDNVVDDCDSAPFVPRSVVTNPHFDWENDRPPNTPFHNSIIYEAHVKGMTALSPNVPEDLRGTYAGLAFPTTIEYLKNLGITAVELMPVHAFIDDEYLVRKGLKNYWGYNTINFFSPEARYAASGDRGDQVAEFRNMVKMLHRAGIEVILDVVYNHTAEGNHLGPTLSFKGIDNRAYYRLTEDARYYMDYTGTGNTMNVRHPQVLKLIMDSLRYWVLEMHVDGFRFDLASSLARELHEVDRLSAFFDIVNQDPVVSHVKLIAEPWDVGEGGYQVGKFPTLWAEWNGKYRDAVRRYWKGDDGQLAELGYRLTGSSDLYQRDGRHPSASVNFVTAHDGFTLLDLVSYDHKHNEVNGEENRDGTDDNHSWNHGAEGPTDDCGINDLRHRQIRNFLVTLLLSQGVPMICGGDEIGRTQNGNNNGYAQDNESSWYHWDLDDWRKDLLSFTQRLIAFRQKHPNLRRRKFFQDRPIDPANVHGIEIAGGTVRDIDWLRPDGDPMTEDEWNAGWIRALGMRLSGEILDDVDALGEPIHDDTFLILINAHYEALNFTLPQVSHKDIGWELCFDTRSSCPPEPNHHPPGYAYELLPRSVALWKQILDANA